MRLIRPILAASAALTLASCSCGAEKQEPAPPPAPAAQATPAPTPAPPTVEIPAADPLPKSDLPWAVAVSEGPVVACRVGENYLDGGECPDRVFAVRIEYDLTETPLSLTTGETDLGPSPEEPCPHYKSLAEQPSDVTQLGRKGETLSPEDPAVKAWLDPLLTGGLKIVRLRAVDIDGDGRMEQFFELDTHPDEHFVSGPATPTSVVGVRTVGADGSAVVTELYRDAGTLKDGEQSEYAYGKGSLYGLTDIEGDGALEAVVVGGKVQDMRYELHALVGGGAAKLAQLACKWGDAPSQ